MDLNFEIKGYDKQDYIPKEYWAHRLGKAPQKDGHFDMRTVGHKKYTSGQNLAMHEEGLKSLLELLPDSLDGLSVLDIGCGVGFHTTMAELLGCKKYVGLDITDVLFSNLQKRHKKAVFDVVDIAQSNIKFEEEFDVVLMIDLAQHLVGESDFSNAMQNCKAAMGEKGILLITAWLMDGHPFIDPRFEVARPIDAYKREFGGYNTDDMLPYSGKWVVRIAKNE